jgi:hypothetical protein
MQPWDLNPATWSFPDLPEYALRRCRELSHERDGVSLFVRGTNMYKLTGAKLLVRINMQSTVSGCFGFTRCCSSTVTYNPITQPPTQHPIGRPPWERQLLLCKTHLTYAAELKTIPKGVTLSCLLTDYSRGGGEADVGLVRKHCSIRVRLVWVSLKSFFGQREFRSGRSGTLLGRCR